MRKLYAGLDVSLEMTSICVVDGEGTLVFEGKALSEPQAIREALAGIDGTFERVGFEAGPLSPWLFLELTRAGLPAVCIEARHAKAVMAAMSRNKNDRNDARRWCTSFVPAGSKPFTSSPSRARSSARFSSPASSS